MTKEMTITERKTDVMPGREGPLISVTGYDFENRTPTYVPKKNLGKYAFKILTEDIADVVIGDIPDTEGTPVIHVGDHFGKHYWNSHDNETVPVDVLERLRDDGYTLVRNADGDWFQWNGRPEFSETEMDLSDAEAVDMDSEIADRRDE